jgi:ribosomal protein S17
VLPTDKPSRLFKFANQLHLDTIPKEYYKKYNIYITSDEEIKDGDWVLNIEENTIFKPSNDEIYDIKNSEAKYYEYCKKIILTTDQDLIKDGVQAIDDEFLEWFVKNPSCEFVDVEGHIYKGQDETEYKIIIPKEEPKNGSISECVKVIIDKQLSDIEELKQEVGKVFYESADKTITVKRQETFTKPDNVDGQWLSPVPTERAWQEEKLVEIFGHYPTASPKWQYMNGLIQNSLDAKQMYSEQELRNAMDWMLTQYFEFHEWPAMGRVNHYIQTIKQED